jgi:predicted secreted protein
MRQIFHWCSSVTSGLIASSLLCAAAWAGPTLSLQASARSSVPNDEMVVQLAIERSGTDIGGLNEAVLAALNDALAQAKQQRGLVSRLGAVTTQQQFNQQGKPSGWTVRGELVLEGRDLKATGELAGRLSQKLQIAGVSFRLSDARRTVEEQRLLKEAAAAFAARAKEAALAFGFSSAEYKQLAIQNGGAVVSNPRGMAMMRGAAMAESMPTEGGDSNVTIGVSGTVELK